GRHPDHYTTGRIGYEACFLAGLARLPLAGTPHRPHKIVYASTDVPSVRPTFVVDITAQFEKKLKAILCYASQFSPQQDGQNLFPSRADLRPRVASERGGGGDNQNQGRGVEAVEVCAQDRPGVTELEARVGERQAPGQRSQERVDVEAQEIHARDAGGQGDEGASHRKQAREE